MFSLVLGRAVINLNYPLNWLNLQGVWGVRESYLISGLLASRLMSHFTCAISTLELSMT
jgi:hypothetical protein